MKHCNAAGKEPLRDGGIEEAVPVHPLRGATLRTRRPTTLSLAPPPYPPGGSPTTAIPALSQAANTWS